MSCLVPSIIEVCRGFQFRITLFIIADPSKAGKNSQVEVALRTSLPMTPSMV
jgi:hypothetical protein